MSVHNYKTHGTCSQLIHFELKNGKIHNVSFIGGCNGNLQGISRLVEGMDAEECIVKLKGIRCGFKPTSCPDQLAHALEKALMKEASDSSSRSPRAKESDR